MEDRDAQDAHMARHMADDGGNGERKRHGGTKALSVVAIVMSGLALAGTIASVTMTSVLVKGMASGTTSSGYVVADSGVSYNNGNDRHSLAGLLSDELHASTAFVPDVDGFYDLGNGTSVRIDSVRAVYNERHDSTQLSLRMTARNDTGHTTQVTTVWRAYASGEQVGGVLYGSTASIQNGVQASLTASTAIENEQDFDKVDLVFGVSPVDSMTIRDVPVEHYTTTADGVAVAN